MTTRRSHSYWRNLGLAASHLLTAIIGARYDLSFSAQVGAWSESPRLWSRVRAWVFQDFIDYLFRNEEPNHCQQAWFRWQRIENILRDIKRNA